jgi:protein gp37
MATSSIEWTELTWNPTTGCDKVSSGCRYCYAEAMTRRLKAMGVETREVLERIDHLSRVPASVRFLSCEPLIGTLGRFSLRGIDWVIVGGESGPSPRPIRAEWVLDIKSRCQSSGVPFFFKQWGGRNKKAAGRELEGEFHDALPTPKNRLRRMSA